MKRPQKNVPGFTFVQRVGDIVEYTLASNGLRVLLLEDDSTPTATLMVTYHVGSRNEVLGTTGSTHILEHLLFKGSERFNKENGKNIDYLFEGVGAHLNATTWFDRTNYYELLPSEHLPLAVAIEADRMRHAIFTAADLASEMTVVRNEYERGENDPSESLDKALWAAAFLAHPYHHPTIGWKSDIENSTAEKLRNFYDTFYWPNNATLSIIGNFDVLSLLKTIREEFGRLERSPHEIPNVSISEPPQEGERRVTVRRMEERQIVAIAHKVPPGRANTSYGLYLLWQILAAHHTGRLHRALVDGGLASALSISWSPLRDEGLFIVYATLTQGTAHEKAEKVIMDELARVVENGVTGGEIKRALATLRASLAYDRDGSYAIASALNEALAMGDWTFYPTLFDRLTLVQPKAIQDIAGQTFVENKRTVGWFIGESAKNQNTKRTKQKPKKQKHQATIFLNPES